MGSRVHYPCRVRLDGRDLYVLWYTDERDGFHRMPGGRLVSAASLETLLHVAASIGAELGSAEPADYDFDRLAAWCRRPRAADIDCNAFLNCWNFFDDLADLRDQPDSRPARLSRGSDDCYDKLFWGSNLPAVTPPGERYEPAWGREEVARIRRFLAAGLALLRAELAE